MWISVHDSVDGSKLRKLARLAIPSERPAAVSDAFWDGHSLGTKHMIATAEQLGLDVRVVRYEN